MKCSCGQEIKDGEIFNLIIDGNKLNNKIENLKLFSTTNEHTSFHGLRGDLR